MAAPSGATVLSVGSVTIVANGGQTGDLLAQILAASAGITTVAAGHGPNLPTPPATGGPFELVIPADFNPGTGGTITIPSGYKYVVYSGTDPLQGGDPTTAIIGNDLSYTGSAATLVGAGGGGTVNDTTTGALMSFFGDYTVTAGGNNDTVKVDTGSNTQVTVTGTGDTIDLGGGSSSVSSGASAAASGVTTVQTVDIAPGASGTTANVAAGANDLLFVSAAATIDASGGSSTVVTGPGGVVTLNATGGSQVVFDFQGGNVINAGASTEFVAAPNVPLSTYNATAGGADTIFSAGAPIDYSNTGGEANSLFFLGGAGAVTVSAAAAETVFGGTGGGSYTIGATSFEFFGGGGADTLTGAAGASSVLAFGETNEKLTLDQASGTKGNTLISFGNNDSINASLAAGGNTWQVVNQSLPAGIGGTFTGNTTLVGSTAGSDLFVVYIDPNATTPPAHTIDIANWQTSDTLFLSNLGSANQSLSSADLAAVNAFDAGSSHSLTLSDGTTIDFTGAKPTTIAHV